MGDEGGVREGLWNKGKGREKEKEKEKSEMENAERTTGKNTEKQERVGNKTIRERGRGIKEGDI